MLTSNVVALDFGAGAKLVAWSKNGRVAIPRLKPRNGIGARSQAETFADKLEIMLSESDIVFEASTPGSSGAEKDMIAKIAADSSHEIWLVSCRAVKNYMKDAGYEGDYTDLEAVQAIYEVSQQPGRAYRFNPADNGVIRHFTSVRPYDKRDYRDPQVDEWMSILPDFDSLSGDAQVAFGNGCSYSPATVLPLAMGFHEPSFMERPTWSRYIKIIGLYEQGHPSFYRRKTVDIMQLVAKSDTKKEHVADLTKAERKAAWIKVNAAIKELYMHVHQSL